MTATNELYTWDDLMADIAAANAADPEPVEADEDEEVPWHRC